MIPRPTDNITEKPILFSAPMVRAILDGRKTQTRRMVKPQPDAPWCIPPVSVSPDGYWVSHGCVSDVRCRYPVGTRVWVKEAWRAAKSWDDYKPSEIFADAPIVYEADAPDQSVWGRLRPAMFMPHKASRITLEVTDVRVQRLQEISEADAIAEGVAPTERAMAASAAIDHAEGPCGWECGYRDEYRKLWDQINGTGSWAANTWVWVYTFRRIKP